MPLPSLAVIGVSAALVAASVAYGAFQRGDRIKAEATVSRLKADLDTATAVNLSNAKAAATARAEADAERERAMARQRERDALAASVAALREKLSDASHTCVLPDGDLRAIDDFLRGGRSP